MNRRSLLAHCLIVVVAACLHAGEIRTAARQTPSETHPTNPDSISSETVDDPFGAREIWHVRQSETQSRGIYAVVFSPDGNALATRNRENELTVYDLNERSKRFDLKGHEVNWIETIDFSPDSQLMVTAAGSGEKVKVWNATTGRLRMELETDATAAYFSADGEQLAILGRKQIEYFGLPSGLQTGQANWQLKDEQPVCMSRDGKLVLLSRSINANIVKSELLNLNDKVRYELLGVHSSLNVATISPDNRWLAVGSEGSERIHLWNLRDPRTLHYLLDGHLDTVSALAFSHDGRFLVSAGDDHRILVWDILTRQLTCEIASQQTNIRALGFSRDHYQIASGGISEKASSIWVGDLKPAIFAQRSREPMSFDRVLERMAFNSPQESLSATQTLIAHFDQYHDELSERIVTATGSGAIQDMDQIVEMLSHPDFQQRERATRELALGVNHWEKKLRELMKQDLHVESRYRIRKVLNQKKPVVRVKIDDIRRWHRIVFALEIVRSDASIAMLKQIATGHPAVEFAAAAQDALDRIGQSH